MQFDTKIAIVLRENLAVWQKLNVTMFLTSGIMGQTQNLLGEDYKDAAGNLYNPLCIQPCIVLSAPGDKLHTIYMRALSRDVPFSPYIEDMFSTGHDAANCKTVLQYQPDTMPVGGSALREDKKLVDKIAKGTKMHA